MVEADDNNLLNVADCTTADAATQLPENTPKLPQDDSTKGSVSYNNNDKSYKARKEEGGSKQARNLQSFGTRIDPTILHAFKNFVFNKHGKLNNAFRVEIENAFEHYIACRLNPHQSTNSTFFSKVDARHRSDVTKKLEVIARKFLQHDTQYPYFSPDSIKKIIWDVLGRNIDKRTFNKYLQEIKRQSNEKPSGYGITNSFDVSKFCAPLLGISEDVGKTEESTGENI